MFTESSDDDKIVEYKWQELKGPLTEKNKIIKSGVDSPILQLKSLLPGVYTYKWDKWIEISNLSWWIPNQFPYFDPD